MGKIKESLRKLQGLQTTDLMMPEKTPVLPEIRELKEITDKPQRYPPRTGLIALM
jgi:hypothetical protein